MAALKMSAGNINVENVDWDTANGFLGFTINKGVVESQHARVRFNIKEFTHNADFKETPFNDQNYKRMNVLHIMGEKVEGIYPILRAAHWDVNRTHEIRMWQVPDAYKEVVKEIVSDWNETFRKIGAITDGRDFFVVSDTESEHAFDLRYSTIAWVADDQISTYSPLGIGMTIADVKNGEIQWGMITLYGGYIEKYIKAYAPSSAGSSALAKMAAKLFGGKTISNMLEAPPELKRMAQASPMLMNQFESERASKTLTTSFLSQIKENKLNKKTIKQTEVAPATAMVLPEKIQDMFAAFIQQNQNQVSKVSIQAANESYSDILSNALFPSVKKDQIEAQKKEFLSKEDLKLRYAGPEFDRDRTFADVSAGWAQGSLELKGTLAEDKKVLRHVVKELITHEYGHFLGLGHQFKENILPTRGTVPESEYRALAEKASEKNGYTNYSSVMGYRNPRTEIADYKNDIKPGPQDMLVLRFLYNNEFATYKTGDTDFTFATVPENGIIPDTLPGKSDYKTSYFPQCNDTDASLSMDPFCNRFDRGYDAVSIVKNYFSDLNDTMTQSMVAFTGSKGGCGECIEGMLWHNSMRTMGRVRLFYDYMRLYYKNEIDLIRTNETDLFDFSAACNSTDVKNENLRKIFEAKPSFKILCQANSIALEEYKNLVKKNAVDFTKKDALQRYTPGGLDGGDAVRDWSKFTGAWSEMTGLPMKIYSLYALTTGVPWADYGFNVPLFDDPNLKFSYSSLYPQEYTQIIAANITQNMHFASLGQSEKTTMGSSIVSMGWLNYMAQAGNNDSTLFPPQYVEQIRNQGKFQMSAVAVILKGRLKDGDQSQVDGFDGVVYDFTSGKSTPLTNAYLLPGGAVFVDAPDMFLYPVSRFKAYEKTEGFVFAYKLDYYRDPREKLGDFSVKNGLKELNDRLVKACVIGTDGNDNGLSQFFSSSNSTNFKGFTMTSGLERGDTKNFLDSIDAAFTEYYRLTPGAKAQTCLESLRGLGLIISSAAVTNGYWLPEVSDYIQK